MRQPILITNLVGILFACIRMLVGAFSVIYLLQAGVSVTQIGLMKSFQAAVIVFIDIPLSYISDNYSRKFSIGLSIVCAMLWLVITGLGSTFSVFLLAEFFNALSLGLMSGTYSAYLYDVNKREKAETSAIAIFAAYQKYQYFFMGFSALIGAALYQLDTRIVWFLAGAGMLLVLLIATQLPKDDFVQKDPNTTRHAKIKEDFKLILRLLYKSPHFGRFMTLAFLGYGLMNQALIQYWQVLVHQDGADRDAKIELGLIFFMILMAQAAVGKIIERWHQSRGLEWIAYLSLTLTILLMAMSDSLPALQLPYLVLAFFSCNLLLSLTTATIIEHTPSHIRATSMSAFATLAKILMFATMPVIAILIEQFAAWPFVLGYVFLFGSSYFLFRSQYLTTSKT